MKSYINKIKLYWLRLSDRERLSITFVFFVVVFIAWNNIFFEEIMHEKKKVRKELAYEKNILKEIDNKIANQQAMLLMDPDAENKNLIEKYTKQSKLLDVRLKKATIQIMPVKDMVSMVKDILISQKDIEFVSLENKPTVAEYNNIQNSRSGLAPGIVFYRHTVVLKIKGSYQSILEYIKILEKMPWKFFWDEMDIDVINYPEVFVTLELYTLGFGEGILGV